MLTQHALVSLRQVGLTCCDEVSGANSMQLASYRALTLLCVRNPGLGGTVGRFLCWSSLSGGSGIRSSSSGVSRPDREGWELYMQLALQ